MKRLIEHWQEADSGRRAYSTTATQAGYIKNWILPHWGSRALREVKAVEVEQWLGGLNLAPGTKKELRDILYLLHEHAMQS